MASASRISRIRSKRQLNRKWLRRYATRAAAVLEKNQEVRSRLLNGEDVTFERACCGETLAFELNVLDTQSGDACLSVSKGSSLLSSIHPVSVGFDLFAQTREETESRTEGE
jgi:hypothetical protein